MDAKQLKEGFYWTGVLDEKLQVFDIIMRTDFGTTYNSYVLCSEGKTVLFETVKAGFFDEYLTKLQKVADITKIDYLVVSHTEPDHAGSVERLLEYSPGMQILATPCAVGFLKEIVNRDFAAVPVKNGQEIQAGGRTLRFFHVPNLHWPDTMYTYIPEEQILVTCDSFGAHYCLPGVTSDQIVEEKEYESALQYYFDHIIGPFKPFMRKALQVIKPLEISMICTGHGPVLTGEKAGDAIRQYERWCAAEEKKAAKKVVVAYVSAYGYTGLLAGQIEKGLRAAGEGKDLEVCAYDMVTADASQVSAALETADGILLGTPTILGDALRPIWDLTFCLFPTAYAGKHAGAFGSYGWSGEGVPNLTERMKQLKMKVCEGLRVRFKPDEAALAKAYEYGREFAEKVLG